MQSFDLHQIHVYFSQQTFELTWPLAKTTALDLEHSSILISIMNTVNRILFGILVAMSLSFLVMAGCVVAGVLQVPIL